MTSPDDIQFTLRVPGNYPRDLCQLLNAKADPELLREKLALRRLNEVVMTINLRNFGEVLDAAILPNVSELLTEFYDYVSESVQLLGGSHVNKYLGDGILAYFGDNVSALDIYELLEGDETQGGKRLSLRKFLNSIKQKHMKDINMVRLMGMTCLLTKETCWIGAIGTRGYRDFTMLSSRLFKAFRALDWVEANTTIVSHELNQELALDYVTVKVYPSPRDPLFYSVARKKTAHERETAVFETCDSECDWYPTCAWAHQVGKSRKGKLDCHDCFVRRNSKNESPTEVCWNWGGCKDKIELREMMDLSPCCSACERHLQCFHNYCRGFEYSSMLRCTRPMGRMP